MNVLLTKKAIIRYADFPGICVCEDDDPANFGGFRIERDGLYVIWPGYSPFPGIEDRAALSWHPTGNYDHQGQSQWPAGKD